MRPACHSPFAALLLALLACRSGPAVLDATSADTSTASVTHTAAIIDLPITTHRRLPAYGPCPDDDAASKARVDLIRRRVKDDHGNFLGDTDENDIYGHPAFERETFTVWDKYGSGRMELYFQSVSDSAEYALFLIDLQPILVCEDHLPDERVEGDSIFFHDQRIIRWNDREGRCVTDEGTIAAKNTELLNMIAALRRWHEGFDPDPDSTSENGRMDRFVRAGSR